MTGVTLHRNQPNFLPKVQAQVGYALIAVVAAVETAVSLLFTGLSFSLSLGQSAFYRDTSRWLSSSAFSLGWSVADFFLNLQVYVLVADEASARAILRSGNLMWLPPDALLHL